MAELSAVASTAFPSQSSSSSIGHEHRIRRQAGCHVPGSLLTARSSLSASPLLRNRPASSRIPSFGDLHLPYPYFPSCTSPFESYPPPPRGLGVRSSMSGGQPQSFPEDPANRGRGGGRGGGGGGDSNSKSSSPAQQPIPPQSKQPSDSSSPTPPADPLWQDVFPTYLQNRESDLPTKRTSLTPRALSPGSPPGVDRSLGPSTSSPNFSLGQTEYPMQYQAQSTTYYSPADISSSRYKYSRDAVRSDPVWAAIRAEARLEAEQEPILSSFLYASILAHDCFERSLGFVLANRLKNVTLLATQLMDVFDDVLMRNDIREAIRADVQAVRDRDPSCRSYSQALLYYKGFHALQSYRISHALWNRGQKILALALQSRISEVFAVDIHPAARIGQGILMDHGTGVVIGETAVIGDNVSMLQGVTLGGTGKEAGDRHPKVQEGVLIGAGATVLGNIAIGRGSMIAAGSLVLKSVPPHSMVAGTPAKVVGTLKEDTPSLTMKHDVTSQYTDRFNNLGDGL